MINENNIDELIEEYKNDKKPNFTITDEEIENKLKIGIQFLNNNNGVITDFSDDLISKSLLFNYVYYDFYNILHEFKKNYQGDLNERQIFYISTSV